MEALLPLASAGRSTLPADGRRHALRRLPPSELVHIAAGGQRNLPISRQGTPEIGDASASCPADRYFPSSSNRLHRCALASARISVSSGRCFAGAHSSPPSHGGRYRPTSSLDKRRRPPGGHPLPKQLGARPISRSRSARCWAGARSPIQLTANSNSVNMNRAQPAGNKLAGGKVSSASWQREEKWI